VVDFEAAFAAYQKQDWDAAEAALRTLNARSPRALYDIYLERIAHFRTEPPPADWTASSSTRPNNHETHRIGLQRRHRQRATYHQPAGRRRRADRRRQRRHTLDFEQLLKIDHVVLTHAHLDHVLACR